MKTPRLPDLDRLTPSEKDALILSLWETVQALDKDADAGEAQAPLPVEEPAAGRSLDDSRVQALRERIRTTSRSSRNQSFATRAGGISRLLDYRPLQIFVVVIALAFLADFAIGRYQQAQMAARRAEVQRTEQAASGGLFMELVRAGYDPGKAAYRATLRIERVGGGSTLYILQNPPRVFIQTGLTWQEVASRSPDGTPWGLLKLDGGTDVDVLFDADIEGWSELIPGYMHVQLQFDQLISLSSEPGDDIADRNNRFYFYLKPHDADDAAIRQRAGFRGVPPAFIPMPPH
ncbi:hypothetical protein EV667_2155 [Ancylobacter aquaticus]|uniref:Uncharacterized protein n=1 Tax=Ancylobacter aquaticus TaxID=100 RepID=A0A4R1I0E3_ANCAQ|nr:hypothetical protein [Ancylobacter aquaticus]TCK28158.1 hypothetical protein EV667_2155 [Ancylobacter aquaticus]